MVVTVRRAPGEYGDYSNAELSVSRESSEYGPLVCVEIESDNGYDVIYITEAEWASIKEAV